jgi:hypothetical protein
MRSHPLARGVQLVCALALVLGVLAVPATVSRPLQASSTPTRVTVPGSFNSEIGCTNGDWSPSCNGGQGTITTTPNPLQANDLTDQGNGVWARRLATIPTGNYEYKAALNGDWAESYAGRPTANGNTVLNLAAGTAVKFYFDTKTDFVADDFNQTIYTVPGNFNSELGCTQAIGGSGGDWEPPCLRTLMSDTDGDGTYTFKTTSIPAGDYQLTLRSTYVRYEHAFVSY